LVVGPGGDPTVLDGTLLGDRLLVLLTGPEATTTVGPLIAAVADYVAGLDAAAAEQFMSNLLATFRAAAEQALIAADAEFNPQLTVRGRLQPMLLGIPAGDPDQEIELIITKRSLGFTATGSVIEQIKMALGGAVPEPLVTAAML